MVVGFDGKKGGLKPSFDARAEASPDLPISKVVFRGHIGHFETDAFRFRHVFHLVPD